MAMLVLGIALQGLLVTQWNALQRQHHALLQRQVLLLLSDFAVRMQLNVSASAHYRQRLLAPLPTPAVPDLCAMQTCTVADRAQADVTYLANELQRLLPSPSWQLQTCHSSPEQCLSVTWEGARQGSQPFLELSLR